MSSFDSPWKEALELYLRPFLELCFPSVARDIDWDAPLEFLDKELQEIVRDADLGPQFADKLVRVRRLDGEPEWVLIHVEVQAQPDANMPRRMYWYHHRISDRYGCRVATLVVLADDQKGWRPGPFEEELWGCRTRFEYPVSKLLDFDMADLERRAAARDAAAVVVAAHRITLATRRDMDRRKAMKWALTRRLYECGYSRKDVLELWRLIDWLIDLPPEMELEYRNELNVYEGGRSVPYVTSIERLAREEGIAEGREAAAKIVLRFARKRIVGIEPADEEAIRKLPLNRLEDLSEALLDLDGVHALRNWLSACP